ncbi:Serine/threonine-protein kinase PrkC [Rubripirellula amarantea]|uniref:non-specific serine/threonine protein kinase n=1 Tax=Rubripirellula amarantea TaxID=2527999 RepID=A0A5C5WQC6_9BACT|nr:serine/threonine-protein kinase [Rubripirellula amarantea]TWT52986.1 Serine/threonine-protein kinase PrkC [Rubripirellula amarantea]
MNKQAHPSDEVLQRCVGQTAEPAIEEALVKHLDECVDCQNRMNALVESENIVSVLKRESASTKSAKPGSRADSTETYSLADFAVAFLEPSNQPDSIGRLGEFEILSVIGHGGMGIVLKGFQQELNRPVAVKVMSPHLAMVAVARKRFLREAQATAAIVHPNVMPILSVSESASLPFLVMPFVACLSLQQRLDMEGPLPIAELLRIAVQVAHGLAAAHAQGLVHRDVKPANILLERSVDRAMLTDFGLARAADDVSVTRSGVIAGTPEYMSPEQARGEPIDARSDLFSLGSVIYACATGYPPFRAETSYGVLRKISDDVPRPMRIQNPEVPSWLEQLTGELLAKQPASRPDRAHEVAELLERCLAYVQHPTVHTLPKRLQTKATDMKRLLIITVLAALTASMLIGGGMFAYWLKAVEAPSRRSSSIPYRAQEVVPDPLDQELRRLHDHADELMSEIESGQ